MEEYKFDFLLELIKEECSITEKAYLIESIRDV